MWPPFSEQQSPIKKELDDIRRHGIQMSNTHVRMMEEMECQISRTLASLQLDDQPRVMVVEETSITERLSELTAQVQHLSSLIHVMPAENRILRRLFFPSIFRREQEVVDTVENTFSWIFNEDSSSTMKLRLVSEKEANETELRRETSQNFLRFLREDGHTFFITGKAGCGKSTFMKYVAHHVNTEANLEFWADMAKLVTVRLFLWQSDDSFQASVEGFWRSILFQLLSQCPELIFQVFPPERQSAAEAITDAVEFRASDLESAFAKLLQLADPEKYRFVFFIDGLDEHEGDNTTHARLAKTLTVQAALANVKIVCSARPYTVFLDAFQETGNVVEFHKLTRSDIVSFAKSRFETSLTSTQMLAAQRNCVALVECITLRAEGVFVWASIAVRALINQALDHDGEERALRQRLEECPDDLNDLFKQMLSKVDSVSYVRKRSNIVLYLAVHNPFEAPLNMLLYSWLDDLGWCQSLENLQAVNPVNIVQQQYLEGETEARRKRVEALLHQVTRGLLEVVSTDNPTPFFRYRVDLFHRSARDFLKDQWKLGAKTKPFSGASDAIELYCRLRSLEARAVAMQGVPLLEEERILVSENLRALFDYTFFWLTRCSAKGNHASMTAIREFETALHEAESRFSPFLLGLMLITDEISWRYHSRVATDKCSFVHLAAYYGQEKFVKSRCGPRDMSTTIRSPDLSLLLSSSCGADVRTVINLLQTGFRPGDAISLSDHHPENYSITGCPFPDCGQNDVQIPAAQLSWLGSTEQLDVELPTVWMVFLRDLAINVRLYLQKQANPSSYPYHLDRSWLERLAGVVEAYLKAGADSSVYFIVLLPTSEAVRVVDLYRMLDIFNPENLASITELLSKRDQRRDMNVSEVTTNPSQQSRLEYSVPLEAATLSDLRFKEWRVLGVHNESGDRLTGSFKVRVF